MKKLPVILFIFSGIFCSPKHPSAYKALSEQDIKEVTIKSYQFSDEGNILSKMESSDEIHQFKSWFKASENTFVAPEDIARFKQDGIIEINFENEQSEIYFQLFNCYKLEYEGAHIYERFSYRFGQTLLELFEKEAESKGQSFEP